MGRTRSVLLILMLLAGSLSPPAAAQEQELRSSPPLERGRSFQLEPNYPNPVSSETFIPFTLDTLLFQSRDSVIVSLRILNPLGQIVAIPAVVNGSVATRIPIINLAFHEPGTKIAHWDGRNQGGQPLPSGVYYCQMRVRGELEPDTRKIIVLNSRRRRTIIPWFGRDE
jgi:hypothetical protein